MYVDTKTYNEAMNCHRYDANHRMLSSADDDDSLTHHVGIVKNNNSSDDTASIATTVTTVTSTSSPPRSSSPKQNYIDIDSRDPVMLTYCPHCLQQNVHTTTKHKVTTTTSAAIVVGFFIFWPAALYPALSDQCKQTNHYCENCGVKVGRVKAFR